jgi:hypothetical protein
VDHHVRLADLGPRELVLVAFAVLVSLAWILMAIGAGFYAARLRRTAAWGLLALIVSPLPVYLLLFGMGPRADDEEYEEDRISCPFCAEDIKPEALRCPHCHSDVTRTRAERLRPR